MLKLKLQYFGHLMWRTDSLEKTLMLGKIEGRRRRGSQGMKWSDGITNSMTWVWASSGRWWWTGKPGMLQSMGSQWVGHDWETEQRCHPAIITMRIWKSWYRTLLTCHVQEVTDFFLLRTVSWGVLSLLYFNCISCSVLFLFMPVSPPPSPSKLTVYLNKDCASFSIFFQILDKCLNVVNISF